MLSEQARVSNIMELCTTLILRLDKNGVKTEIQEVLIHYIVPYLLDNAYMEDTND